MTTTMEQTVVASNLRKPKQYKSEFEKRLMVDNLRAAVEIFGKDQLRAGFNCRRAQSVFR